MSMGTEKTCFSVLQWIFWDVAPDDFKMLQCDFWVVATDDFRIFPFPCFMVDFYDVAVLLFEMVQYIIFFWCST
jgi:hypothetical protein